MLSGQKIKIISTRLVPDEKQNQILQNASVCGECVIADSKRGLFVRTGDGVTEITELQFPNSKRMNAKAALNSKKCSDAFLTVESMPNKAKAQNCPKTSAQRNLK